MYIFNFLAIPLFYRHIGVIVFESLAKVFDASFLNDIVFLLMSQVMMIFRWRVEWKLYWRDMLWSHRLNFSKFDVVSISLICWLAILFGKPQWTLYSMLTVVVEHLCRHQNLTSEMLSTASKVGDIQRLSIDESAGWLKKQVDVLHLILVQRNLDALRKSCGSCYCLSSVHSRHNQCSCLFRFKIWRI